MKVIIIIVSVILLCIGLYFIVTKPKHNPEGVVIILNGPSSAGKTTIQKEFQKLMMPNLWVRLGIDGFFDAVMPEITPENISFWQSKNAIRWVERSKDEEGNDVVTLYVGHEGQRVAYAMNSAIAAYVENGCKVIVDYIAYDEAWVKDLETKLKPFKTYYVAVELPLETLEQREENRGTSPKGHARSHYATVYSTIKYDLKVNSQKHTAMEIARQIKQLIETK